MLTSERKFGVEIEFIAPNKSMYERVTRKLHVVFDGSLRPHRWGGEYVSSPLTGNSGVAEIRHACQVLKQSGVDVENPQTSVHLHIDGRRRAGRVEVGSKPFEGAYRQIAFSRAMLRDTTKGKVSEILLNGDLPYSGRGYTTRIGDVVYYSMSKLTRAPRMNYVYFALYREDRFNWLRNMLYFYTQYGYVMDNLVSNSRRSGNSYIDNLSNSFSVEEIEVCQNMDELMFCWYKGNDTGGHYDNSRYHNVNFHSYWDRHGTVEIRSHGGTIDPNKILLWTRLHQYIADKLEDKKLEDIKLDSLEPESQVRGFLEFISEDPVLVEYVKRLLGYFSGISIKNNEVKGINK